MTALAERDTRTPTGAPTVTMAAALNRALADALRDDETVLVFGEDVAALGGVFRVTDGLAAAFGEARVFDTPLAESGIVGTAIGMAMNGLRPVVEMQFDAFAYPAFEQITSHLAKLHNRTRGRISLPIVIRIPYGGGIGGVEHHCDSSEAYYTHTAGLRVVTPATPGDAYALLRQAIDCPDPVIFLEPKRRYWSKETTVLDHTASVIDQAIVRLPGTDVTLIAYGGTLRTALDAADEAQENGHSVEVIDLRSLSPFDDGTVTASVRRTGRAIVIHEASRFCGYGAEVAARLSEQCFHYLEAPILRVTGLDIPYPPPHLEQHHLPSVDRILDAINRLQWCETATTKAAEMPAFLLPDLGEGLTEAEIVTWRVRAGDVVAVDQTVVEVETAKAVVEVPVPFAGRVTALHGEPGDVLAVGAPLITVAGADTERDRSPTRDMGTGHLATPFAEPGVATPDAAVSDDAGHHDGESGNVLIGYGTSADRRRRRAPGSPAMSSPAPAGLTAASPNAASPNTASTGGARAGQPPPAGGRVAVVSPLVRRLAREAGLDITAIRGSGRDGLITRHDVDLAIEAHTGLAESPAPDTSPKSQPASVPERGINGVARIPIRGVRKAVADKLSRSRREIPEATVWVDVDATELIRLRATLNADESAPKISLLAMFSRYTILGLHRYPELNARIEGDEIVLGPAVHLGFAAQTDRGLMVPVVPDAHECTLEQLSLRLAERTQRARDGKLGPGELTGGTFTINNYGVFGVDGSAAIINHPEVAILGIGRIIERPWVVDGQIVARQMTQLTLAFDHRVCDGGTAGGFLRFVADCVESPAQAMRNM